MSQAILNQILVQLETLEPAELQQLSQIIQKYLRDREASVKQMAFHRSIVQAGLVRQIKNPIFVQRTPSQLIQVQGKSVSQTIVEERR